MKSFITFVVVCLLSFESAVCATVDIKVKSQPGDSELHPQLMVHNLGLFDLLADENGDYSVAVDIASPVYATLYYDDVIRSLIWLRPGDRLVLVPDRQSGNVEIDGGNADINRFLNGSGYRFASINDTGRDEDDFLLFTDSINDANQRLLRSTSLPAEFKEQESQRIFYENVLAMSFYPEFHPRLKPDSTYSVSDNFYRKLKEVTRYDSALLASKQYSDYIINSLGLLSRYEYPGLNGFERFTAYLDSCVNDRAVAQYIFNRRACSVLARNGVESAKQYIEAFPKYVTDSAMTEQFRVLYREVISVSPGQPSPQFDCEAIDGSRRSLKDYAGKWVYIDIWATWCGPCRREIPHLRNLEAKYSGLPIEFVSISSDSDRDAWRKLVTKQNMKGEQLRFDGKDRFMESYKITGIPRFILLDQEGKIVDPDMTRPSDPATVETLDKLLGL